MNLDISQLCTTIKKQENRGYRIQRQNKNIYKEVKRYN
jgi:hypothetical protein